MRASHFARFYGVTMQIKTLMITAAMALTLGDYTMANDYKKQPLYPNLCRRYQQK